MKENRLRVLVIEGDPDRVQLLEEAFGEMEELRFVKPSYPFCLRDYALDWHEAVDRLARLPTGGLPDAIVLNISHDCSPSPAIVFGAMRKASPASAIILAAAPGDEPQALRLIRLGAQDYLLENEIDCDPLARVLRCAVERSRLDWSRRSVALLDDLTGLYNRRGVELLAGRDDRLAAALDLRRWSVELRMHQTADSDSDVRNLKLAEQLNELSMSIGLLAGRAADDSFVLMGLASTDPEANASAENTARRLVEECSARGIPVSVRIATEGRPAGLCENR